ncbi:MAG: glycosyltransferase family 2 protein, partial [Chitinivibrionales bacterium]
HINRSSSMLTRGQAIGIDGHFMIEQAARSWNSLFMNFNGTAGMFRISAIEDAGGWQHDTLTEDMDLSYRLQLAGWKAEFLPELPVPAEIPEDVNAFKSQQFRWASSMQTAIKIGPRLFKRKDVSIFKKIQAMLHLTHYCVHPLMLAMIILTLPMLTFVHIHLPLPFFVVFIFAIILASSGPSFMYMVSQHFLGQKKRRLLLKIPVLMVIGTGLVINNTKAVLEAVMNKTSPFIRTPKKGAKKGFVYSSIKDFMFLLELLVGVYCAFTAYLYLGYDNAFISPFLVLYMSGCLFMGMLSLFHTFLPVLIDFKLPFAKERD